MNVKHYDTLGDGGEIMRENIIRCMPSFRELQLEREKRELERQLKAAEARVSNAEFKCSSLEYKLRRAEG